MQIHYIWISSYKQFDRTGINLSSEYIFEMREDYPGHKELTITKNNDFIPNFFGKESIENVTCIVGKNGAGKTSILNYIKDHMPEGLIAGLENDLIAYSVKRDNESQHYLCVPEGTEVTLRGNAAELFRKVAYDNIEFDTRIGGSSGLRSTDYIYYTYNLEANNISNPYKGLLDISTEALMARERREVDEGLKGRRGSELELYARSEIARGIQLISKRQLKSLPFKLPKDLEINIDFSDRHYFNKNRSEFIELDALMTALEHRNNSDSDRERTVNNVLYALFINYLIDERKYSTGDVYYYSLELLPNESMGEYLRRYFTQMRQFSFKNEKAEIKIQRLEKLSALFSDFLPLLEELFDKQVMRIGNRSDQMFLAIDDSTEEIFQRFFNGYLSIKGINSFFSFGWRGLSHGESSYLALMSRFFHVRYHEMHTLQRDIVIMIDEGDAGFHPEWQRKFFNITLKLLSEIFDKHRLQLIFAANTPFIPSDLTKHHVLFIEKRGKETGIVRSKDNDRQLTFGANIYNLFADSFYMDGAIMGDFAKERIDEIISYLNDKRIVNPDPDKRKLIEQIGEPVLRRKLLDMWTEKFGIQEELALLEQRVKELKAKARKKRAKK